MCGKKKCFYLFKVLDELDGLKEELKGKTLSLENLSTKVEQLRTQHGEEPFSFITPIIHGPSGGWVRKTVYIPLK